MRSSTLTTTCWFPTLCWSILPLIQKYSIPPASYEDFSKWVDKSAVPVAKINHGANGIQSFAEEVCTKIYSFAEICEQSASWVWNSETLWGSRRILAVHKFAMKDGELWKLFSHAFRQSSFLVTPLNRVRLLQLVLDTSQAKVSTTYEMPVQTAYEARLDFHPMTVMSREVKNNLTSSPIQSITHW